MMYVAFPETTAQERLAGLEPLDLSACCDNAAAPPAATLESVSVEMAAGEPVLRWTTPDSAHVIGLGGSTPPFDAADAAEIARTHMARTFGTAPPMRLATTGRDQWTVT